MANFEPCLHCDGNVTSDGPEPSARHDGLWCIGLETLEIIDKIRGVDLLEILASEKRVPAPSEQLTALQKCDERELQRANRKRKRGLAQWSTMKPPQLQMHDGAVMATPAEDEEERKICQSPSSP
ncbi:predicted protein [Histoplasma capsulatum G186AR]|uniref:Uncharacterized protein n=1 Tax=Ajellomyces capsulatus (strain G186AR / H82 / ATCC MYA-2454 / RMSCC 2432) TaxID=447093 RepID=C0NBE5_AJECG|nr:uncharacterized protein HCBG_00441 [Histoplasma capsulatum G186AR]EEH10986.1 predicted protein [Histoplasma capsulatum G186AR]